MRALDTLPTLTLWTLSVLIFPTSLAFIITLYEKKSWCFADECLEGRASRRTVVQALAGIFYGYLVMTAAVAVAARRMERLRAVLCRTLSPTSTVTIAEIGWFGGLLLLVFPVFFWSVWSNYWAIEQAKMDRADATNSGKPWITYFYETLTYISGDMCAILIGFVLLPTSKNSVIAHYLRMPYITTVRLHRWLGYTLFLTSSIHAVLAMSWKSLSFEIPLYQLLFTVAHRMPWGTEKYRSVTAFPALLFLGVVVVTSVPFVRRRLYSVFIWSHACGIAFVAFAYFHNSIDIYFAIPALLLYAIDLTLRLGSRLTLVPITSVSSESGYMIITAHSSCASRVLPGQFMRVTVPAVSRWEAHPWSVTCASGEEVKFLVGPVAGKNSWTERVWTYLGEFEKEGKIPCVSLQGPYGNPIHFAASSTPHDAYVFFAAGSGISPAIAAITHLLDRFACADPLDSAHGKIHLVWSTGRANPEQLSYVCDWFGEDSPVRVSIYDTCVARMDQPPANGVVKRGRVNARHVMHKVVDAAAPWDESRKPPRVAVFVCGPGAFARQVVQDVATAEKEPGVRFTVHEESFEI